MLKELHAKGTGPQNEYHIDLAPRLNLFTGDNGLGKTFILDLLWYACTFTWAKNAAHPNLHRDDQPTITGVLESNPDGSQLELKASYDWITERWTRQKSPEPFNNTVAIYAGVQGEYVVWDSLRTPYLDGEGLQAPMWNSSRKLNTFPESFTFNQDTLWNGLYFQKQTACNGLLTDLVNWQISVKQKSKNAFALLGQVLLSLSAPGEPIRFGESTRIASNDVREFPTIVMPYATIPVNLASSAMRRIIEIAYLIVWSWTEHLEAAAIKKLAPAKNFVLIIDEVENHLHPTWQRAILPALLTVTEKLTSLIEPQLFITTHSPLVLASLESVFTNRDQLYLIEQAGSNVELEEIDWIKHGDSSSWLTSEIFGLEQARSIEAETLILQARDFMMDDLDKLPSHLRSKDQIEAALKKTLALTDRFWSEWDEHGGIP